VDCGNGLLVFQYAVLHDDTVMVGLPIKPLIAYIDCGAQTTRQQLFHYHHWCLWTVHCDVTNNVLADDLLLFG